MELSATFRHGLRQTSAWRDAPSCAHPLYVTSFGEEAAPAVAFDAQQEPGHGAIAPAMPLPCEPRRLRRRASAIRVRPHRSRNGAQSPLRDSRSELPSGPPATTHSRAAVDCERAAGSSGTQSPPRGAGFGHFRLVRRSRRPRQGRRTNPVASTAEGSPVAWLPERQARRASANDDGSHGCLLMRPNTFVSPLFQARRRNASTRASHRSHG